MKTGIFIILGYGIPKDILEDENYNIYLKLAFNAIFDISSKVNSIPSIIFCGGKTDMFEPYERTEAGEMIRLFKSLMDRQQCKDFTADWKLIAEDKSISTLENLIFAKEIVGRENIEADGLNIIFEFTRLNRIKILAEKIFNKEVNLISFDFNQSAQRYLSFEFIKKKEDIALIYDEKVTNQEITLKKHHDFYAEKLRILRTEKPENHDEAIKRWWISTISN